MCYVIAGFLSGGETIRDVLLPEMLRVVKGRPISSGHRLDEISTLKALGILHHYSNIASIATFELERSDSNGLSFWPLKYQTEMYALRLNLYKSAQGLTEELAGSTYPDMEKYQRYLFWLQIFVSSH